MLQIQDTLISLDVLEQKFCCDLSKCKGACCVHGDSGAPLTDEEIELLEEGYESLKPYMRQEGRAAVEAQGTWVIDVENDKVTPLVDNQECAYVIFEDGIALCAIERAYGQGDSKFKKPISCHLYPVRVKRYRDFTAVNYDEWDICKDAKVLGKKENLRAYVFLEEPLQRAFGDKWYSELKVAAKSLEK